MIEINLRDILQKGQEYVAELSEKLGIPTKAVRHDIATDTCYEKLDILGDGWTIDRIIKAIFLGTNGGLYGLVFPELGTRENPKRIKKVDLGRALGLGKKQMNGFHNSVLPENMDYGTCSPFVLENAFEENGYTIPLKKIFIYEPLKTDKRVIDISIGGYGDDAHKTSLQLPADGMCKILTEQFGENISFSNFFN